MSSPAYLRFVESMNIGYMQWHDGTGYDLEALAEMTAEEHLAVEAILVAHLKDQADWRDVEALAKLDTPGAKEAVIKATDHHDVRIRKQAGDALAGPPPEKTPEEKEKEEDDEYVEAIKLGGIYDAIEHPSPRVKRALLDRARLAGPGARAKAAAVLMYVCGQANAPFDESLRPFFEKFESTDMSVLRAAWTELRERTGV